MKLSPLERWLRNRYRMHSGESRFVQNGYPKKTKNQSREDWRKRKGFARDQANIQSHRRDGCPPWMKRMCNKAWRQWVRQCLDHQRYDLIPTKTRKDFFDPWMWD